MITSFTAIGDGIKIVYSSHKPRKKARRGDLKTVRGRTMIRQQVITREGCHVRRGGPVWEWVERGSEYDQDSPGFTPSWMKSR